MMTPDPNADHRPPVKDTTQRRDAGVYPQADPLIPTPTWNDRHGMGSEGVHDDLRRLASIDHRELADTIMALLETSADDGVRIELPAGTAKLVYSVSSRGGETSPELDRPSYLGDRADLNWRLTGALAMIIVMRHLYELKTVTRNGESVIGSVELKHGRQWCASSDSDHQQDTLPEDDQQWNASPDDDHGLGLDHQGRHDDEIVITIGVYDRSGDRLSVDDMESWSLGPAVWVRRDRPAVDGMEISFLIPANRRRAMDLIRRPWALGEPDGKMFSKLMIELAGLDGHDPDAINAYSESQHDFVVSYMTVCASAGMGPSNAWTQPSMAGLMDAAFMTLLYGCGSGGHETPDQVGKLPTFLKIRLMTAVYGSCRFRASDMYDAAKLSSRLTQHQLLGVNKYRDADGTWIVNGDSKSVTDWFYRSGIPGRSWWTTCLGRNKDARLSNSILQAIPDDLRPGVTMDRLLGLESRTRFLKDFMFLNVWNRRVYDAVVGMAGGGVIKRIGDEIDDLDLRLGTYNMMRLREAFLDLILYPGGDDHGTTMRSDVRMTWFLRSYPLAEIIRLACDLPDMADDPMGSLGLIDIMIMLSTYSVLVDDGTRKIIALGQEDYGFDTMLDQFPDVNGNAATTDLYARLVGGDPQEPDLRLVRMFMGIDDAIVRTTFRRTALLLGNDDDGLDDSLPEDYLDESLRMDVQGRYNEAVTSCLMSNEDAHDDEDAHDGPAEGGSGRPTDASY